MPCDRRHDIGSTGGSSLDDLWPFSFIRVARPSPYTSMAKVLLYNFSIITITPPAPGYVQERILWPLSWLYDKATIPVHTYLQRAFMWLSNHENPRYPPHKTVGPFVMQIWKSLCLQTFSYLRKSEKLQKIVILLVIIFSSNGFQWSVISNNGVR